MQAMEISMAQPRSKPVDHLKVLVIDDDKVTCNLLETVLQLENFQTASASKIANSDIIALLNQEAPHFLILDFHLNGEEALKYIASVRNNPGWQLLPIIITSAIDRRRDCLVAGANEFVLKPFNWQEIIESINRVRAQVIEQEV
jgi:DNA-binding response OmpR family regulator